MNLRRALLSAAVIGGCAWCLVVVQKVHSEEQAAPAAAPYKPVAPVHPLMEGQDYHWSQIGKLLKEESPNFKHLEMHAYVLAELSNVNSWQKDKPDYRKWAVEARDLCLELAKAAKAKDTAKGEELRRQIHAKCGECHDKYQ